MKELILGGARSGKSHFAETCAAESKLNIIYVATAQAFDDEMQQRIQHHQQQRPVHWRLIEEPLNLLSVLKDHSGNNTCILVDCLTLWLSNQLCSEEHKDKVEKNIENLVSELPQLPGKIIFVSNEVSMGIIPMGEINRQFVDEAGRLHQRLAAVCDKVTLMVAGIPRSIKGK
ncbi:MAG: bifunctional adenosylcobinamide kinase/adenosylcobinamide-phosphate guanylyltransferase [Gammaproteobacteria bacterium]|nr:bifunctional adenosylcobinamide kinase/adenosylcobinamide-phosphate guanylyltransferase [Gammaproteobacteria bacterium]MCW8988545.1 bifunctional adenosylcobinamide kinase/adenosylcobinamide-phosphate guanylyltransferase [Gammaproteobacteria bacterium]